MPKKEPIILKTYLQLNDIYNKKGNNQPCIDFLKLPRKDAVLDSAGRLFHSLAPREEKHFCPFADLFFGNLKSVSLTSNQSHNLKSVSVSLMTETQISLRNGGN